MKTTRALLLGTIATLAGCSQADNRYQLSEGMGNHQIWFDTQTGETLICAPGNDLSYCDHRPAFAEHVAKAAAARSKSEAIERKAAELRRKAAERKAAERKGAAADSYIIEHGPSLDDE